MVFGLCVFISFAFSPNNECLSTAMQFTSLKFKKEQTKRQKKYVAQCFIGSRITKEKSGFLENDIQYNVGRWETLPVFTEKEIWLPWGDLTYVRAYYVKCQTTLNPMLYFLHAVHSDFHSVFLCSYCRFLSNTVRQWNKHTQAASAFLLGIAD